MFVLTRRFGVCNKFWPMYCEVDNGEIV